MQFTSSNYPILQWHHSKHSSIHHFLWDKVSSDKIESIKEEFDYLDLIRDSKNINDIAYISTPFFNAVQTATTKLFELIDVEKFINDEEELNGILLLPNGIQVLYAFWISGDEELPFQQRDIIVLNKTNVVAWGKKEIYYETPDGEIGPAGNYTSFTEGIDGLGGEYYHNLVLAYHLFKRYSEVETKVLDPKKPSREFNAVYVNHSKSIVTVYDSTWFTTLIRSDSFKVRGHFRLQPVGEGRKERRLTWVKEHQREGYIRSAKKLLNDSE